MALPVEERVTASRTLRASCLLLLAAPLAAQVSSVFPGMHVAVADEESSEHTPLMLADIDLDGLPDVLGAGYDYASQGAMFHVARGLAQGGFATPEIWTTVGKSATAIAVGSLDGDAWPDVALGDSKQRIVVAHGAGGGIFGFSAQYYVGSGVPAHVAIADVNHDGIGDLISSPDSGAWLDVNLANGTGGYLATESWATGNGMTDMEIADLDGDGWIDVLFCTESADQLAVMLGDGAGGFLPPQVHATSDAPTDVLVDPLDGDGFLDVLVVCSGPSVLSGGVVRPFLGDGTGALTAKPGPPVEALPRTGRLFDLDDDGDLDAVVVSNAMAQVTLLLNDGSAAFAPGGKVALGAAASSVLVFDATGDGVRDLFSGTLSGMAAVYPADADGTFPESDVWFDPDDVFRAFDVADVDGDELPDVVFIDTSVQGFGTVLGEPGGLEPGAVYSPGYALGKELALGDLDGDVRADVVLAVSLPPRLLVGHAKGTGTFAPPATVPWTASAADVANLVLADLDGDGWRDAVGVDGAAPATVATFLNQGAAQPGQLVPTEAATSDGSSLAMALGDLDGDGAPDVVLSKPIGAPLATGSLLVLRGDGQGGLLGGHSVALPDSFYSPESLALADFDLDGRLDAAVGRIHGSVLLALGDGDGGLLPGAWSSEQWSSQQLVAGDIDGDGWPDVVHAGGGTGFELVLRLGDGTGGLSAPVTCSASDNIKDLALADCTQDGRLDLLVGGWSDKALVQSQVQVLPAIADPFVWTDLGSSLAGTLGEPRLTGTGELLAGTPGFVRLTLAAPSALAALFVAADAQPTPFKGGTLVPVPPALLGFLVTDGEGVISVPWSSWPSSQPGADWFFQFGVLDAGAPHGVALSNAVSGTEPAR